MKFYSSGLFTALCCGSLLLSLSAPSAQKNKSRKHQTPTAQKSTPTPTPTPASLAGSYALNESGAAERVKGVIEEAVKDLSFVTKEEALSGLMETNVPPPNSLTISFTDGDVLIETDTGVKVQTSMNGKESTWSKGKDTYKVSTIGDKSHLERTYRGRGARRVNIYSLSDGGNTLTMHVTVERKSWPGRFTLAYDLVYRRTR